MNKMETFLVMVVLIADIFVVMSLSTGGTITSIWMNALLFANGLAIGDTFYTVFFQDAVKNLFKKEK